MNVLNGEAGGGGEALADGAVLVGAGPDGSRHVGELGRLATTLGMEVSGVLEQGRRDGSGYIGRGKREELRALVEEVGASFVVTDDELTASQSRVLERSVGLPGVTVVDRTELIIRIFEAHARDAASRLEVELADLEYRLPRVKGRNPELSRLGGGASAGGGSATRGPGEQQLEYDRRVIRRRIETINRKLREDREARAVRGARLRGGGPPAVALVGYTNAGKTTILNALSGAGRSTKDRLFETLETTTRLVEGTGNHPRDHRNGSHGPDGAHGANGPGSDDPGSDGVAAAVAHPDFVITDTVGFIRKLPTQLVHSFASTLEAARDADVRILCADASSPSLEDEIRTVGQTLSETLGAVNGGRKGGRDGDDDGLGPTILCLNKMDLVPEERRKELREDHPDAVAISAHKGCEPLLEAIYRAIAGERERMQVLIPHAEYAAASRLYGLAEIHSQRSTEEGLWMDVSIPRSASSKYAPYKTTQ